MARSVLIHPCAEQVVYLQLEPVDEFDAQWQWNEFIDDVRQQVREKFPAFAEADRWVGRETRVILESRIAEVSVSEYNGIVAVCLAPRDGNNGMARAWCSRAKFRDHLHAAFGESALISMGTFSNGEQAFRPVSNLHGLVTSKEGTLW